MIAYVRASGSPFQVGRAHGAARRDTLQAFLADGHARLDHLLPAPVDPRLVDEYAQVVRQALPDLAEEISGLAVGAGIHEHDAFLLQVRRELLGYSKIPTRGDCTTYARAGEVLAQTVDLNGNLDDVIGVLDVERDGRRALILTFGGLLGYLGVNSAGLAVGLNLVLGGDWRPGVPPYLAIRHLLDQASSVDEAVKILAGLPLASSRSIMLCDATAAGYAEILDGDVRFVPGAESVHTNHFLEPGFAPRDEMNVFARNSSRQRLDSCQAALAGLPAGAGAEEHFALLAREPICVPDLGDIRRERTVAAAVMFPGRGELHVRPGNPALAATEVFAMS